MFESVETDSVVDDFEAGRVVVERERQTRRRCAGVFDDVLQAFLRDAVQRDLDVVGQPRFSEFDLDVDLADGAGQARQPACQAQIVEHRWS